MDTIAGTLFALIVAVLLLTYSIGWIFFGGKPIGKKWATWELRQLVKFGRWSIKLTLKTVANLFNWLNSKI